MRLPFSSFLVFRRCRSRLHSGVHQCNVSGWCCGVKIDFHVSVLQAPRITEYSQQHVTVPTFFLVSPQNAEGTIPLLRSLTMCSLVLVLKPSKQPPSQFIASFCCGPKNLEWLEEDLFVERGNLLIECFASGALASCHTATANMECLVQATPRLICQDPSSPPVYRSVKSLTARICPRMVWFVRSMLPLALPSPTGISPYTISDGMRRASFVFDVDDTRFPGRSALQYHFLRNHDSCLCKNTTLAKNAFVNAS